jgi:hypothetical protein
MPFLIENWRTLAVLALVASIGAYGLTMRLQRDAARTELATFKEQVAEAAQRQTEQALKRTIADEQRKEKADAENADTVTRLRADVERLRRERDSRSSSIGTAPAASKCPDGQVCFDRAEFERAYRALVADLRAIADEGAAVTVDLDTAKKWAQGR